MSGFCCRNLQTSGKNRTRTNNTFFLQSIRNRMIPPPLRLRIEYKQILIFPFKVSLFAWSSSDRRNDVPVKDKARWGADKTQSYDSRQSVDSRCDRETGNVVILMSYMQRLLVKLPSYTDRWHAGDWMMAGWWDNKIISSTRRKHFTEKFCPHQDINEYRNTP